MRVALVTLGVVLAMRAPARADDVPPWAAGVSDAHKAEAKRLLDEGNASFVEHDYVAALDRYNKAIAEWDHPAIRFNVVRCLIQLDRPLEAYDQLQRALAFGAKPLEEAVYTEALAYQKLLAHQIGELAVACEQPGVALTLDGQPLVACPGAATRRLAPGRHQVVGTKAGFLTHSADVVVLGGAKQDLAVTLVPLARAGTIVHRWPAWMPWLVAGGGLAVAGVGGLIEYQAAQDMSAYDRALVIACLDVGCDASHPIPPDVADRKRRAQTENGVAVGVMALGASAAITGGVLLYLNRGRTIYPDEHLGAIAVTPARGGAAISFAGHF